MNPGRSTTKSRGSPGGEVAKMGSSKLGPIDWKLTAPAREGATSTASTQLASKTIRTLAFIPPPSSPM
jgi:hypothetical protein